MTILSLVAGYSLLQILVFVIVVAAAIGITMVVLRQMGVSPPGWVIQVAWIIGAAVVGVLALFVLFDLIGRIH
jgi:hypothetical protein